MDVDGTPLRFTPHDFRRIFATETVNGGLPIHIAAKLLGHLDLNTTQGYVAVYPQEVIRHYRRFVDQRRARRPSKEYREPTDIEWAEFRDHFSLRKVALGTCDRPYGTPCQHEHDIRCPMLRPDPLNCHDWSRSRSTPVNSSKKPARCNGSARSPACRTASAISPTRSSWQNAFNSSRPTATATTRTSDDQRNHRNFMIV